MSITPIRLWGQPRSRQGCPNLMQVRMRWLNSRKKTRFWFLWHAFTAQSETVCTENGSIRKSTATSLFSANYAPRQSYDTLWNTASPWFSHDILTRQQRMSQLTELWWHLSSKIRRLYQQQNCAFAKNQANCEIWQLLVRFSHNYKMDEGSDSVQQ